MSDGHLGPGPANGAELLRRIEELMAAKDHTVRQAAHLLGGNLELVERIRTRGEWMMKALQGKGTDWGIDTEVKAILPLLPQQGAVVFDVGANKGLWTRELLAQAGPQVARIYAFEPASVNVSALTGQLDPRVELVPAAAGKEAGVVTLYGNRHGSGLSSVHRRRLQHFRIQHRPLESVQVITLDGFTKDRSIERIDFMKMDIEGHELYALEGAGRLLQERRIQALSFEFGGANIDSRTFMQDFWYLLTSHGFRLFRIHPSGALVPVPVYTEDLEMFTTTNYVAVLND